MSGNLNTRLRRLERTMAAPRTPRCYIIAIPLARRWDDPWPMAQAAFARAGMKPRSGDGARLVPTPIVSEPWLFGSSSTLPSEIEF